MPAQIEFVTDYNDAIKKLLEARVTWDGEKHCPNGIVKFMNTEEDEDILVAVYDEQINMVFYTEVANGS
jgi:hypothetical protein